MRYWKFDPASLGTTDDDVDLSAEPGATELTLAQYEAASDALRVGASTSPVITSLAGNNAQHVTNPAARRVTISVIAPIGGNMAGRPSINGKKAAATSGGAPYVLERPGAVTVATHAGNNDLVIVEEF